MLPVPIDTLRMLSVNRPGASPRLSIGSFVEQERHAKLQAAGCAEVELAERDRTALQPGPCVVGWQSTSQRLG